MSDSVDHGMIGRSAANMERPPVENEFVTIKATGEHGRWIETYSTHDGTTLLIMKCCVAQENYMQEFGA